MESLFGVFHRAFKDSGPFKGRVFGKYGVNPQTYLSLHVLSEHTNMVQTEIAETLDVDKSLVTRTINDLVKRNLVYREIDPNDKRKNIVVLSEEGYKLMHAIDKELALIEQVIVKQIDKKDLEITFKTINTIMEKLTEI